MPSALIGVVPTVVVGHVKLVVFTNEGPQVIRRVAVATNSHITICLLYGVPVRLVVIDVILTAKAVTRWMSQLSTLVDGVALDVSLVMRFTISLFSKDAVLVGVTLAVGGINDEFAILVV
jgi:hypothetical protein